MSAKTTWTPYGLEAIRIRYLRRRRLLALLLAFALAGTWAILLEVTSTTSTSLEIYANGERANTISFEVGDDEPKRDGPVSISLSPGRVTRADTAGEGTATASSQRISAPVYERARAVPYGAYVILYGPYALLGLALWLLAKRRGKHDEVNYGIYKGAMPLEMISASQSNRIFTTRWAKASLFGKRRGDHLPAQLRQVGRIEPEDA